MQIQKVLIIVVLVGGVVSYSIWKKVEGLMEEFAIVKTSLERVVRLEQEFQTIKAKVDDLSDGFNFFKEEVAADKVQNEKFKEQVTKFAQNITKERVQQMQQMQKGLPR